MLYHFQSTQRSRANLLAKLKTLSEDKINQLKSELQAEHLQLVKALCQAEQTEITTYDRLLAQNEQQLQTINDYTNLRYKKFVRAQAPAKPIFKNTCRAFFTGGMICLLAQIVINFLTLHTALDTKTISGLGSVSIIFLTAVLTGLGIYDEIGRFGGAGSMVPISGFANSIVSAALEFKREGMVYGIGAKIFTIAGPVILYGTLASVIIGIIYYLGG